ncbi:hypothetical protein AGMMS49944_28490 [Spirochaetia bacterium]|nr:hypothetical protein AGMMS49944_28490 [Spirochaetia bacterium]
MSIKTYHLSFIPLLLALTLVPLACEPATGGKITVHTDTTTVIDGELIAEDLGAEPPALPMEKGEDEAALSDTLARLKNGLLNQTYRDFTNYTIDLAQYADTEYVSVSEGKLYYPGMADIWITLKNSGAAPKTITLKKAGSAYQAEELGSLFTIRTGVRLIVEDVTLKGLTMANDGVNNNAALVKVEANGIFELRDGAAVKGNCSKSVSGAAVNDYFKSGGVHVLGTFLMKGGSIEDCEAVRSFVTEYGGGGGAVFLADGGAFVMEGGVIKNNTSVLGTVSINNMPRGGGPPYLPASFIMKGGEISGNEGKPLVNLIGGGTYGGYGAVYLSAPNSGGTVSFRMEGGVIKDNATLCGVQMYSHAEFVMDGAEAKITGNKPGNAHNGGVQIEDPATCTAAIIEGVCE